MGRLEGKVALVSGSGRGIGRAIALKLAAEGASVVINDLDEVPAAEVVQQLTASGARAAACIGDVADPAFAGRFVSTALDRFGGLDIIVNNAGFTWDSVIQKTSDDQFQAMLDVHLVAPFRILRAAAAPIRAMAKREAAEGREVFRKVVNVSSIAGLGGNAGQVGYSSAKAALTGLTRTLCKEWGRYKVNVNCVAFGLIETRLTRAIGGQGTTLDIGGREIATGIQPKHLEAMNDAIPLGRAGTPEEAAGAVYLLCTPEANYISGQVIVASGGLTT